MHPVSAHSVCFCLSAAAGIRLVLLGETGRFCSDLGVSCCDQSTKNTNNNHVSKACPCTLCKYLVGRLCVDHNVKYRRNDHPCSEVGNNLHNVEQHDLFLLESAVLDRIFCSEKSDQNTEYRIWEYPAPPIACPRRPTIPPTTGPNTAARNASNAALGCNAVFGINPRGICTSVSATNSAVPIPVATTSLIPNFIFITKSSSHLYLHCSITHTFPIYQIEFIPVIPFYQSFSTPIAVFINLYFTVSSSPAAAFNSLRISICCGQCCSHLPQPTHCDALAGFLRNAVHRR